MMQLLGFNVITGQLSVQFGSNPVVLIEVPIEDGAYLAGDALLAYLKGFAPQTSPRTEQPANADAVTAMCTPVSKPEYTETYSQKRAREYPNFLIYLDGVVKGDVAQQQAYIDECLAIKARYPKELVSDSVLRARLGQGT